MLKSHTVALSLFSGCGGLNIGSFLAGAPPICSLDIDEDCTKTLSLNKIFEGTRIFHADIASFPTSEFRELLSKSKPKKFILIGGPPCQPFSKAGYWVKNVNRAGIKDSRNLFGEFLRVVEELEPDGFLIENVESIFHPMHRIMIEIIEKEIRKLNYNCRIIRANALDYGVPQKRKRVFIIASRKKFKTDAPIKTHCPPDESHILGLQPYESVRKHISKFDDPKYFEEWEVTKNGTYARELREVPPGKNYLVLTEKAGYKNPKFIYGTRYWSFLLKLHPDQPSWTIAAQPGPWIGPFHWKSRRLRVPEISAIQTFPEDYKFYGSRRSIQRQVGNAVPPLLGKAMVEFLKSNI